MRLEMVRLATEPYAYFKVDDREVKRGGHSYTIETLEAIRADLPQVALCLMIGIDQFANFNQWERWQEIPNFAHVVVNSRTGFEGVLPSEINDFYKTYSAKDVEDLQSTTQGKILSLQLETLPISSTLIREKIKRNEDVCSLLPKKVWEYIRQKKLYGSS